MMYVFKVLFIGISTELQSFTKTLKYIILHRCRNAASEPFNTICQFCGALRLYGVTFILCSEKNHTASNQVSKEAVPDAILHKMEVPYLCFFARGKNFDPNNSS